MHLFTPHAYRVNGHALSISGGFSAIDRDCRSAYSCFARGSTTAGVLKVTDRSNEQHEMEAAQSDQPRLSPLDRLDESLQVALE